MLTDSTVRRALRFPRAPIAQLAEAADLKSAECRFESDWGHRARRTTPDDAGPVALAGRLGRITQDYIPGIGRNSSTSIVPTWRCGWPVSRASSVSRVSAWSTE